MSKLSHIKFSFDHLRKIPREASISYIYAVRYSSYLRLGYSRDRFPSKIITRFRGYISNFEIHYYRVDNMIEYHRNPRLAEANLIKVLDPHDILRIRGKIFRLPDIEKQMALFETAFNGRSPFLIAKVEPNSISIKK